LWWSCKKVINCCIIDEEVGVRRWLWLWLCLGLQFCANCIANTRNWLSKAGVEVFASEEAFGLETRPEEIFFFVKPTVVGKVSANTKINIKKRENILKCCS
jgi:hypothetical protein